MPRRRVTSRVQSRSDGEPLARRRDMRLPRALDLDVEQRAADEYGGNYSAALRELVAGGVRLWDGDAADLCLRRELAGPVSGPYVEQTGEVGRAEDCPYCNHPWNIHHERGCLPAHTGCLCDAMRTTGVSEDGAATEARARAFGEQLSGAVCDRRRGHPLPHTFAPEWRLRGRREPAQPMPNGIRRHVFRRRNDEFGDVYPDACAICGQDKAADQHEYGGS